VTQPTRTFAAAILALSLCATQGCKSRDEQALDQAKQQAASTGQAQQMVSTDKNGNTTTTVVQPPLPGQSAQTITRTTTTSVPAARVTAAHSTGSGSAPVDSATQPSGQGAPSNSASGDAAPQPISFTVPAGTHLAIRIHQRISAKHSYASEQFTGDVAQPVSDPNGQTLIPTGAHVTGVIDEAHRRGHFKGRSILEMRLTSLTLNGQQYPISTRDTVRTKKGKGKRSTAFIGGGTGVGMLIGGLATGGTGLLIGGLSGAGAGTALAGLTGNRDIEIPAESVMQFRLADDLVVQR
jgi:hypothetical protein